MWNVCNHGNIGLDITNHKPTCTLHYIENPHLTVNMHFKQNALNACIYHIVGNFRWCKILQKCVHTPQKNVHGFFGEWIRNTLATTTSVDGHTSHANWRNEMKNNKAKKYPCTTTGQSSFRVKAYAIMKLSRLPWRVRNWLEQYQHCWSWLWHLQGVS